MTTEEDEMNAAMLRDAADTLTERVSDLAHTVAEVTPEVTSKVGETAQRLAAITPWVEAPRHGLAIPRWLFFVAVLTVLGVVGWKLLGRSAQSPETSQRQPAAQERRMAAVNA